MIQIMKKPGVTQHDTNATMPDSGDSDLRDAVEKGGSKAAA